MVGDAVVTVCLLLRVAADLDWAEVLGDQGGAAEAAG